MPLIDLTRLPNGMGDLRCSPVVGMRVYPYPGEENTTIQRPRDRLSHPVVDALVSSEASGT